MNTAPTVADYFDCWELCLPRAARLAEIDGVIVAIMRGERRYDYVAQRTPKTLPWAVIGLLHYREASLSFNHHLHNGDPLRAKTVNVPAGRPLSRGPWTWEESALDALKVDKLDSLASSDIATISAALERFNGGGYWKRGLRSPYLYGGSGLQQPGKYVTDGVFNPTVMDKQLGCITILKRMVTRGLVVLRATPAKGVLS